MSNRKETFADRLKAIRESKDLSQRALARLCGISGQAVSLLESGQTVPTWPTVQSLARALGVGCDDLRDAELPDAPEPEPAKKRGRPRKPAAEADQGEAEQPSGEEKPKRPRKRKK